MSNERFEFFMKQLQGLVNMYTDCAEPYMSDEEYEYAMGKEHVAEELQVLLDEYNDSI